MRETTRYVIRYVNHCCVHVLVQFTEYQNCNHSSSFAAVLPKIVICKLVFLDLCSLNKKQWDLSSYPLFLSFFNLEMTLKHAGTLITFIYSSLSQHFRHALAFVLLTTDDAISPAGKNTNCYLQNSQEPGPRHDAKYGQFSNFKSIHQRI